MAVRDFLNEGGKLVYAGETAGYYGQLGGTARRHLLRARRRARAGLRRHGRLLQRLPAAGRRLHAVLPRRRRDATPRRRRRDHRHDRTDGRRDGRRSAVRPPSTTRSTRPGRSSPLSDVLPPDEFPQFGRASGSPTTPTPAGRSSPSRATSRRPPSTTTTATCAWRGRSTSRRSRPRTAPTFEAQLSWDVELGYDHVIVEAHTVGQENWTTLPDLNGNTTTDVPAECEAGFLVAEHPNLLKYLTRRRRRARRPGRPGRGTRSPGRPASGSRWPSTSRPTPASRSRSSSAT